MLVGKKVFCLAVLSTAVIVVGCLLLAGGYFDPRALLLAHISYTAQSFFVTITMLIGVLSYAIVVLAMWRLQRLKKMQGEVISITMGKDFMWTTIPFIMIVLMIMSIVYMT